MPEPGAQGFDTGLIYHENSPDLPMTRGLRRHVGGGGRCAIAVSVVVLGIVLLFRRVGV